MLFYLRMTVETSLTREPLLRGKLSTVEILIKIGRFVKMKNIVAVIKAAVLN